MNNDIEIKTNTNNEDKRCAPGVKYENGSCISLKVLVKMAEAHNIEHDNKKEQIELNTSYQTMYPDKYKIYLLSKFYEYYGNSQNEWLRKSFIKNMDDVSKTSLLDNTFRKNGPQGKWEWLDTNSIENSLHQYETKNPEFYFMGAVPIDFYDFEVFGIRNFDYDGYVNRGIYKFGIIFNLDKHDQPGSHWVAMYSDFKKGEIYFYDSESGEPEEQISELMKIHFNYCVTKMGHDNRKVRVDYNKIKAQYGGSECGVYSMNFILRMLRGDTFEQICNDKTSDKKINKCRKIYFKNTL